MAVVAAVTGADLCLAPAAGLLLDNALGLGDDFPDFDFPEFCPN